MSWWNFRTADEEALILPEGKKDGKKILILICNTVTIDPVSFSPDSVLLTGFLLLLTPDVPSVCRRTPGKPDFLLPNAPLNNHAPDKSLSCHNCGCCCCCKTTESAVFPFCRRYSNKAAPSSDPSVPPPLSHRNGIRSAGNPDIVQK